MQISLFAAGDLDRLPVRTVDAIVIGAGVAGLTFALKLPANRQVLLVTKGEFGESNTRYAQGGLSAAVGQDDSIDLHETDTLAAGAGLCDVAAVHTLVSGAPAAVDWLVEIGAEFDRDADGGLLLGREAAHSRRRVLHAGGDATGWEIERALVAAAKVRPNITVWSHAFAIDLLIEGHEAVGAVIEDEAGQRWRCEAPVSVIAAGGAGQIWSTTSNPGGATADGLAIAIRAGVAVADCEFVQFHPTVTALPGHASFLVSEAVRGEGAYLRDETGERFMVALHPQAELAPRDVVARGIHQQLTRPAGAAFLDLRHLDAQAMQARFPTIAAALRDRGYDLTADLIPITPAAHYFMGGIVAGTDGTTSLPGLLAIGEAACTGIHGANRLASNSLLEGLVFGDLAAALADHMIANDVDNLLSPPPPIVSQPQHHPAFDAPTTRKTAQAIMTAHAGVDRTDNGLRQAREELERLAVSGDGSSASRDDIETWNLVTAARAIVGAALHRCESRGAHFRSDYPERDRLLDGQHSLLSASGAWGYGTLESLLPGSPIGMQL